MQVAEAATAKRKFPLFDGRLDRERDLYPGSDI